MAIKKSLLEERILITKMYRLIRLIIPVVATAATAAVIATFFVTSSSAATAKAPFLVTTTATGAALLFRLRFVNDDLTAHHFTVIQISDGLLRFAVVFHFNETEALAAAGNFVLYDLGGSNGTVLFKKVPKILIGHLP